MATSGAAARLAAVLVVVFGLCVSLMVDEVVGVQDDCGTVQCRVRDVLVEAQQWVSSTLNESTGVMRWREYAPIVLGEVEPSLVELASRTWALVLSSLVSFFVHWFSYIESNFQANPGHVVVETCCIICIVYLVIHRRYDPSRKERLSKAEEQELIDEWEPLPLAPKLSKDQERRVKSIRYVESATENGIVTVDGKQCLNFASCNFLGLGNNPVIKAACRETIIKHGVGACGPRGFVGSVYQAHNMLEKEATDFMGTEGAILYSDGIATMSSVIPCFSKRSDILVCDELVNFNIRSGTLLSRSKVYYYRRTFRVECHIYGREWNANVRIDNDMGDLERLLKSISRDMASRGTDTSHRRFIVTEGIFQETGDISPLRKIVKLKNSYRFRLILDDSLAIGVLGSSGKGSVDHWNLKSTDVEIICATLDTAISSVGGICWGSKRVIDHQRLSGSGYVFSAASPMYTCTAAIQAFKIIDQHPELCERARSNAKILRAELEELPRVDILGDSISPVIILRIRRKPSTPEEHQFEIDLYRDIVERLFTDHQIVISLNSTIPQEASSSRPSLRILVSAAHSPAQLRTLAEALNKVLQQTVDKYFPHSPEHSP